MPKKHPTPKPKVPPDRIVEAKLAPSIKREKVKIGLATMFLPRGELCHLEEWMNYHVGLGIKNFWLWDDGHVSRDNQYRDANKRIWGKKPWANYSTGLNDEQVDQKIQEIVKRVRAQAVEIEYRKVSDYPGIYRVASVGRRQGELINLTSLLAEKKQLDWFGFFDVDELILGNLEVLRDYEKPIAVSLQMLMNDRWSKSGAPISYSKLTVGHGVYSRASKAYVKSGFIGAWNSPHFPMNSAALREKLEPADLMHLHFRGNFILNSSGQKKKYVDVKKRFCSTNMWPLSRRKSA